MSLLLTKKEAVALAKYLTAVKDLDKAYVSRDIDGNLVVGFIGEDGERSKLQYIS